MTPTRIPAAAGAIVGIAGILTLGAALLPVDLGNTSPAAVDARSATSAVSFAPASDLTGQIGQLKSHLAAQPADSRSWALLALLLIEQGRVTADPAGYAAADEASKTSLRLMPQGNDLAIAARAALLSAQHRFRLALDGADRALQINPYSIPALGIRVDALTELGRLPAALRAARHFDALRPGLAATTRLAYQAELRADTGEARRLFAQSADAMAEPSARAFVAFHLGDIARRSGHFRVAERHFETALAVLPEYPAAMAGRASILALTGHIGRATSILEEVVASVPSLEPLIALGELYELQGDRAAAQDQYDVVRAAAELARDGGVRPDLELAWFEADHGDPAEALSLARSEWDKRHSPLVADALGWALHVNGMDRKALRYSQRATQYGGDARSWHHRGTIEAALGLDDPAVIHLRRAQRLDRGYSPWQAEQLAATLGGLEARS